MHQCSVMWFVGNISSNNFFLCALSLAFKHTKLFMFSWRITKLCSDKMINIYMHNYNITKITSVYIYLGRIWCMLTISFSSTIWRSPWYWHCHICLFLRIVSVDGDIHFNDVDFYLSTFRESLFILNHLSNFWTLMFRSCSKNVKNPQNLHIKLYHLHTW